ncbi:MAG TPA: hypothetical protein VFD62_10990 [Pyrinomonadaceae bacterium]|nr:hypothetical protein [Pyrinomonadaceae bacterium]
MEENKDVFVIMPFSSTTTCNEEQWTDIYENVFKPAIEESGYSCERAKPKTGSLIKSIIEKLRNARIVLADITDRNPNVFYELGVRHSLSKRTIILAQGNRHAPSDLLGYWFINYGTTPGRVTEVKREIRRLIAEIEENPDKNDNPVSEYLAQESISLFSQVNTENIKKLTALYTELGGNVITLAELRGVRSSEVFLSLDCLKLFLQTIYIDPGPGLLKKLYELHNALMRIDRTPNHEMISPSFLGQTIEDLNLIADRVLELKNRLTRGLYKEPPTISTMVWNANSLLWPPGCDPDYFKPRFE